MHIRGTSLLLEYQIGHFPHIAQNLLFALGVLWHVEKIDHIVFHGPPVTCRHGAAWIKDLIYALGINMLNEESDTLLNYIGAGSTMERHCHRIGKQGMFIYFERMIKRTATSPIWFPSIEACKWMQNTVLRKK